MFFARSISTLAAAVLLALVAAAFSPVTSAKARRDDVGHPKLTALDKREEAMLHARAETLALLHEGNACSAWFQESDDDPATVFESLQFKLHNEERPYIFRLQSSGTNSLDLYKHPWAARSWQLAGANSTVEINVNGPFFSPSSPVVDLNPTGGFFHYSGFRMLTVGPFKGNTAEAQITTLLHELAHVIGRIPADDDSWDRKSSRNTEEILRHCKSTVREFAKRPAGDLE